MNFDYGYRDLQESGINIDKVLGDILSKFSGKSVSMPTGASSRLDNIPLRGRTIRALIDYAKLDTLVGSSTKYYENDSLISVFRIDVSGKTLFETRDAAGKLTPTKSEIAYSEHQIIARPYHAIIEIGYDEIADLPSDVAVEEYIDNRVTEAVLKDMDYIALWGSTIYGEKGMFGNLPVSQRKFGYDGTFDSSPVVADVDGTNIIASMELAYSLLEPKYRKKAKFYCSSDAYEKLKKDLKAQSDRIYFAYNQGTEVLKLDGKEVVVLDALDNARNAYELLFCADPATMAIGFNKNKFSVDTIKHELSFNMVVRTQFGSGLREYGAIGVVYLKAN